MKRLTVLGQSLDIKLSPSFIQTAACPLHLKLHYIDKVAERFVRIAAERGTAAHGAIADLTRFCQENRIQPDVLEDEDVQEAVRKNTPPLILGEVGLIFDWVRLWKQRYKLSKHLYGFEEKIALNDAFEECAWDEGSYRGILDVIDIIQKLRACIVTDYKSQPHIMNQAELDAHEQMTHYAWLASKLYEDIEDFTVRIWYLRYGFYAETSRTREQLEAYEHALMIKERKICDIESWDPAPGPHCQLCDVIHRCPLATEAGQVEHIISQEQAIEAAGRLTAIESYRKGLTEKLKEYINHNDDVRVGDGWNYGFHHVESTSWDAVQIAEVLADFGESGVALSEFVNVDKRKLAKALKRLAKENPELEVAISDTRDTKHSTRFEGYKPGSNGAAEEVD